MRLGSRAPDADLMPAVVVHVDARFVPHCHWTISQIESVVDVTIDQFHCHEIVASSAIEDEQTIGFHGLEAEINGNAVVGLQHGQTHVGVLGAERGCMVGLSGRRVHEAGSQLEGGTGQSRELRSQTLDNIQIAG